MNFSKQINLTRPSCEALISEKFKQDRAG